MAKNQPKPKPDGISNSESNARKAVVEQLFYDFSKSPAKVYWMNLVRGIFFGVGSVIGGTIVVAIILWLLSWLVGIPGLGDFIQNIVNEVEDRGN